MPVPLRALVQCFAQTIKKLGNLCLRLDTQLEWVWCAASVMLRGGFGCGYWSKSLFREFVTVLYDVQMKTLITLLLACCFCSAMAQSSLPTCQGWWGRTWTDCYGTYIFGNGNKYVGEYKGGRRNGGGTFTYSLPNAASHFTFESSKQHLD